MKPYWILKSGNEIVPKRAECVSLSDFTLTKTHKSKFARNYTVSKDEGVLCPSCHYLGPNMDHCSGYECPKCELQMFTAGNALYIWR